MNKKIITFSIMILWLIISLGLIASKQYTISTGKKVLLETVPVDPRDFLRGDYVILSYKISDLDLSIVSPNKSDFKRGKSIYVKLEPREKYWEAVSVKEKNNIKTDEVIVKGKIKYNYQQGHLMVSYGIENYFVPEGKGKEIEQSMRRGSSNTVSVEAIVDKFGNAVVNKLYINDSEVKF
ncbi:MAG: GDYXXLXY domain-containing protein [Elusimicrobia bacterium]|nr:GDYXXLXY domain-containing protein [Elusimicrobiota bacterium]